jgi:hypothetical protein
MMFGDRYANPIVTRTGTVLVVPFARHRVLHLILHNALSLRARCSAIVNNPSLLMFSCDGPIGRTEVLDEVVPFAIRLIMLFRFIISMVLSLT